MSSRFGQDASPTTHVDSGRVGISFDVPRHAPSDAQRREVREWLNQKLVSSGLQPDRLVVRKVLVDVDHNTGAALSREILSEVNILD